MQWVVLFWVVPSFVGIQAGQWPLVLSLVLLQEVLRHRTGRAPGRPGLAQSLLGASYRVGPHQ